MQASPFTAAFDAGDTLRVLASTGLREVLRRLRLLPPRQPVREEGISAARTAFEQTVVAALQRHPGHQVLAEADIRTYRFAGVEVLCITPPGELRGAVIHIHGGGWCLGNPRVLAPALAGLAAATSTVVASIDYRLAPEHRHPAALDDCLHAARALLERWPAERGFGAERTVIAGESAGAHLALLTLLRLRDAGTRLAGAALTYGLYDLSNSLPSRARRQETPALDSEACRFYVSAYLGPGGQMDGGVSPWQLPQEAFAGLPPALFCAGTADPLYDDSVDLHARWRAAGNRAWRVDYEDCPHTFDLLPVPEAGHLSSVREAFVRACLDETLG